VSRQQGRYSGLETGGRPVGLIGSNGRLSLSQLLRCETQPHLRGAPAQYLWAPYARSFDQMTRAAAEDGVKLILIVGYRDYAEQVHQKAVWTARGLPDFAATPGRSTHGLGVTVDIDRYQPQILEWLAKNAPRFGFDWPRWATVIQKRTGKPKEPWHWQGINGWRSADSIPVFVRNQALPEAHAYRDGNTIWTALRPVANALQAQIDGFRDGAAHVDGPGEGHAGWVPLAIRAEGGFSPVRALGEALGVPVAWEEGKVVLG
jgi:hypothetical protein